MLTVLLYPLQDGHTPLSLATAGHNPACVEHLVSTRGTDVNIKVKVSRSSEIRDTYANCTSPLHVYNYM